MAGSIQHGMASSFIFPSREHSASMAEERRTMQLSVPPYKSRTERVADANVMCCS